MNVDIPDDKLKGFSSPAKEQLKLSTLKYSRRVIDEANRIEAGRKPDLSTTEITKAIVSHAAGAIDNGFLPLKQSLPQKIIKLMAVVLTIVCGFLFQLEWLKDSPKYVIFVVLMFGITVAVNAIVIMKE